jgi:hypothetical protein
VRVDLAGVEHDGIQFVFDIFETRKAVVAL